MKHLIFISLILISFGSAAQKTNSYLNDTSKLSMEKYEFLKQKADLEFKLLSSQQETAKNITYKNLVIAFSVFIILVSIFIIVLLSYKSKKISEIIEIQNREILIRDKKNEQLSTVLNTVKSPILISSVSGSIKWVNKAFTEFYKMDISFLNENNIVNFFDNIASEKEKQFILEAFENKQNISYKIENSDKTANQITREITIILDSQNEISGFAVTDNLEKL
jgi:transcriptional regulator of aromatic amino acid metabolism